MQIYTSHSGRKIPSPEPKTLAIDKLAHSCCSPVVPPNVRGDDGASRSPHKQNPQIPKRSYLALSEGRVHVGLSQTLHFVAHEDTIVVVVAMTTTMVAIMFLTTRTVLAKYPSDSSNQTSFARFPAQPLAFPSCKSSYHQTLQGLKIGEEDLGACVDLLHPIRQR